jgi:hypothetical protein
MTPALLGIWIAALAIALFTPDLVSGSEQEHIPFAALTIWFYAGLATAYVVMASAMRSRAGFQPTTAIGWWIALIWAAVAIASIFGPELVTGADPTRLPIAAMVAPVIGMVTTGFLAIVDAGGGLADR